MPWRKTINREQGNGSYKRAGDYLNLGFCQGSRRTQYWVRKWSGSGREPGRSAGCAGSIPSRGNSKSKGISDSKETSLAVEVWARSRAADKIKKVKDWDMRTRWSKLWGPVRSAFHSEGDGKLLKDFQQGSVRSDSHCKISNQFANVFHILWIFPSSPPWLAETTAVPCAAGTSAPSTIHCRHSINIYQINKVIYAKHLLV